MGSADHDHESNSLSIGDLKILAIFIIFLAGMIGAAAPVAFTYCSISDDDDKDTRKRKERRINLVIKVLTCVSLGIILATAFIHLLPEGVFELSESGNQLFAHKDDHHDDDHHDEAPASPSSNSSSSDSNETTTITTAPDDHHEEEEDGHDHPYPFGHLFAMVALVSVFFVSTEINWWGVRRIKEMQGVACDEKEESRLGAKIKLWVTEIGIFVHSIILGITLGVAKQDAAARVLFIVIVVHQMFEGLSIGVLIIVAHCTKLQIAFSVLVFAVSVPIGVCIGIGIQNDVDKVAVGVLYCLSAGVLLYVSCVEMLPHLFGAHHHHAHGPLPVASLHDHIHHHHDHDHDHETHQTTEEEMKKEQQQQESTGKTIVVVNVVEEEKENKEQQKSVGGAAAAQDKTPDVVDEHDEDESAAFRVLCYFAVVVGCSIQAVLGIWA